MIERTSIKPEDLWYTIGLITTDGNLSPDHRHINITSKDTALLESVRHALGLTNKITRKANGYSSARIYGALQFGDVKLYRYLESIGLSQRKSLTLEAIAIDEQYFPDFLRGVIDGDGCIRHWRHPSNGNEQWEMRVYSAAPIFSHWLHEKITQYFKVKGVVLSSSARRKNTIYALKFGKMAAQKILSKCYYQDALSLRRKHILAQECVAATDGWKKSVTVL